MTWPSLLKSSQRPLLWLFPETYHKFHMTGGYERVSTFSSTDTSHFRGSASLDGPRNWIACNTHIWPFKNTQSLTGWACLELRKSADVIWIDVWNKDEEKGNSVLVLVLWKKPLGKCWPSFSPRTSKPTDFCLIGLNSWDQVGFVVGCVVASMGWMDLSHMKSPTPWQFSLWFTLLDFFWHYRLLAIPSELTQWEYEIARANERGYFLLPVVYVRKYAGHFLY